MRTMDQLSITQHTSTLRRDHYPAFVIDSAALHARLPSQDPYAELHPVSAYPGPFLGNSTALIPANAARGCTMSTADINRQTLAYDFEPE